LPAGVTRVDDDARAAIEASHLRTLSSEAIARLAVDASRLPVPPGSTIHREGDRSAHLELVVSGLMRVYVTAPDGRTMTVRYCRPGALIGAVSLFASPFSLPVTIQAVTDADLLAFRPSVVQRAVERDARVARTLLDELRERVLSFIAEIPGSAFATVRQRSPATSSIWRPRARAARSSWPRSASRSLPMPSARFARSSFARYGSCVARASSRRDGRGSCSSTPSGCSARPTPVRPEPMFPGGGTKVADNRVCR
jgi:CRP-like cAMP-binding protein